jgi:Domain of unknown function (DUF4157)
MIHRDGYSHRAAAFLQSGAPATSGRPASAAGAGDPLPPGGSCDGVAAARMLARMSALDADLQSELEHAIAPAVAAPAEEERTPGAELASSVGNRGFGQLISRMQEGEGILPSGIVHPAVESAIAAARGGGTPLDAGLASSFSQRLGHSLDDVHVHTGTAAAALTRAVSARAFATGTDIFFAPGEYQPGSSAGRELIAHEVAHTDQQRGAPLNGPLLVSNPGEPLEVQADGVASQLVG